MSKDVYCGIEILWSWDYRFWSWFCSHGVQVATRVNGDRVFNKIYHIGPLKLLIGVTK